MSYIGTSKIGKMFLGGTEISKAYLGDELVYQNKPYDSEVEYLESTGTQWIDTNLSAMNSYIVRCRLMNFDSIESYSCIFGAGVLNPTSYNGFWIYNTYKRLHLFFPSRNYYYNTDDNTIVSNRIYDIELKLQYTHNCIINGISRNLKRRDSASFGTNNIPYTMHLFNMIRAGENIIPFIGRIYNFAVYGLANETLLDLIPVRVGTTGYMYDKVSGTLFGNSGTGDFVLGNDIT